MRQRATMKIFRTQRFAGYLVVKHLKVAKAELCIFLSQRDKCSIFADHFCDDKWLSVVCYLPNTLKKINTLNLSLQGKANPLRTSNCFLKETWGMETTFWKWLFWNISTIMQFCCQKWCMSTIKNSNSLYT